MTQPQINPAVDDFLIHGPVLERFARILAGDKLAHAYLLTGPEAIGKTETALEIAKLINCEETGMDKQGVLRPPSGERACQTCPSCRKIGSGNHPDVMVIDRGDGQSIRIARIREMIGRSQLRPFEARTKVFLIRNIEDLTPEGSNALLKTLEEPARDSLMLLTSRAAEKLLPTIVSRCHQVHFFPESSSALCAYLKKTGTVDPVSADVLARYSEGCLGRAARLGLENFLDRKNEIINNIIFQDLQEPFLKAVLSDKERIRELLEVLFSWFRDLMLIQQGVPHTGLIHKDRAEDLRLCARRFSVAQCDGIVSGIIEARRLLNENLNMKIPLLLLREKIWARSSG